MLLANEDGARAVGREPIARVVSRGVAAVDPDVFGIAPVEAANMALKRAGIGWNDISVVELNEAFASQCLADMSQWKDLDPDKVNPNGGAIALGHPLGMTGTRLLLTLLLELGRRGRRYGLATACIGGGQGIAAIVERL
jgi:acetyl-CoA acyltransferase